ncbi:hypothetical protein IT575_11115 [bacterium]|nr:hypothetical protein [bacterium]
MTRTAISKIGLGAFAALATCITLGLSSPARAASDYLLELDGVKGESAVLDEQMDTKIGELEALLASVQEQLSQARQIQDEIVELDEQMEAVRKQGQEQHDYMRTQVEEAKRVFNEQVAPFMDQPTIEAVSINFAKMEVKYSDDKSSGEGLRYHDWRWIHSSAGFSSSFSSLQEALSAALSEMQSIKAGWNIKENTK